MTRALATFRVVPCLVVLVAGAGCMDRDLTGMEPVVQAQTILTVPQPPSGKVDILVVVDNSGSMQQEQEALAANFPRLIEELMAPSDPDQEPVTDLHVGIVSTDLGAAGFDLSTCGNGLLGFAAGDDGRLRNTSSGAGGCASSYPPFLSRVRDQPDYPLAQMGEDFRCVATLGTRGCGFEQQIEAARKALVEHARPGGVNDGFLRPDSILAVLWVTDEEDCSVADPAILDPSRDDLGHLNLRCYFHSEMLRRVDEMLGELRALRADPQDFVVAMIVGVPFEGEDGAVCQGRGDRLTACLGRPIMEYRVDPASPGTLLPACTNPSGWGHALPGRRLVEAATLLGKQASVYSICNDDWRPAMQGILDLIQGAIDRVCFPHELALDPATCQAQCDVVEILSDDRACPAGRSEADPPTVTEPDGRVRRRCVIPQAARVPNPDGSCPTTAASGWYYVPRAQSGAADCDQVLFAPDAVPAALSDTRLECLTYVCPPERQCGAASNPGGRCCAADEVCAAVDPLSGGVCVPAF
ncbi:MAG: hypothetical protein GYA57_21290 [Myxococcales bacterium]|nr:hypothetical protein [Myxococcales bacterium]